MNTTAETNWHFDRTGFPYLPVPGTRFAAAVLPVTKAQAEVWLGDPSGPGDDWYAEVLSVGPRAAWRAPNRPPAWQLLLTGVTPDEAARVAGWLGPAYRLPDVREWRAADRALSALRPEQLLRLAERIEAGAGHPAAAGVLRKLHAAGRRTAAGLTLLADGVLEWVVRGSGAGGLGRPERGLTANLIFDPQSFDPVSAIRPGRDRVFGARLLRDLGAGGTA
jgi:hypothetical protein